MSTASVGRAREHRVRRSLEQTGWKGTIRSAGSKGAVDLICAHPTRGIACVQVGGAHKVLGPVGRDLLRYTADLYGAVPVLAQVMPRAGIRWFVVGDGPASTWEPWSP